MDKSQQLSRDRRGREAQGGRRLRRMGRLKQVVEPEAIETRQAECANDADHHRHRACRCGLVGPKGRGT